MIEKIDFTPFFGVSNPHLQLLMTYFAPQGKAPPSKTIYVDLGGNDQMALELSTPSTWTKEGKTALMIHGLGGDQDSGYLVRLAEKFFKAGIQVIRINLRGSGSGVGLSSLPYNSGNSEDVFLAIKQLKRLFPLSPFFLIGFSLSGNLVLKLAGEVKLSEWVHHLIAICPILDLEDSVKRISKIKIYHRYYFDKILIKAARWIQDKPVHSIYDFDDKIIAPLWGFQNAHDYYEKSSSLQFIPKIEVPTEIILSEDDPFIDYKLIESIPLPPSVKVDLIKYGSHMAFLGWGGKSYFWMDDYLLNIFN